MKKIIRLTESDLIRIVRRVISEQKDPYEKIGKTRYCTAEDTGSGVKQQIKGTYYLVEKTPTLAGFYNVICRLQ